MLHLLEPAAAKGTDRVRRSPAVPVVSAVAAGILLDHVGNVSFATWWMVAIAASVLALLFVKARVRSASVVVLLAACVALGGGWHHWRWSCVSNDEISGWATDHGRMVANECVLIEDA